MEELNYTELPSKICICNAKDSNKYLNAIRSKNPELAFQFIYFLANRFPEDFSLFFQDNRYKHRVEIIGMLNLRTFSFSEPSEIRRLEGFNAYLIKKKSPFFVLLSSKDEYLKSKINGDYIFHNYRDSKQLVVNILYYKRVNWNLYKRILEIDKQRSQLWNQIAEGEEREKLLDEIESPDFDEDFGTLGEMSDDEFESYLEKINENLVGNDYEVFLW